MQKFYDYNPGKPFHVEGEWHYVKDGKVDLNYTPKEGTLTVLLDGEQISESDSVSPNPGQFFINYSTVTNYRMAEQVVIFNEADNGKRATFEYDGVSTLIKARHFNEIRDFMYSYNEDRAADLVEGRGHKKGNETVESFAKPRYTDLTEAKVEGADGNVITVSDATGIESGRQYIIADKRGMEYITVKTVNKDDRVLTLEENLKHGYSDPRIYRTTAVIKGGAAIAEGSSQDIEWFAGETWRGTDGAAVVNAGIKAEEATLDGVDEQLQVDTLNKGVAIGFRLNTYMRGGDSELVREKYSKTIELDYEGSSGIGCYFYNPTASDAKTFVECVGGQLYCYGIQPYTKADDILPDLKWSGVNIQVMSSKGEWNSGTSKRSYILPAFYYLEDFDIPIISTSPAKGFKLHPAFIDENGNKLKAIEYIPFNAATSFNPTAAPIVKKGTVELPGWKVANWKVAMAMFIYLYSRGKSDFVSGNDRIYTMVDAKLKVTKETANANVAFKFDPKEGDLLPVFGNGLSNIKRAMGKASSNGNILTFSGSVTLNGVTLYDNGLSYFREVK